MFLSSSAVLHTDYLCCCYFIDVIGLVLVDIVSNVIIVIAVTVAPVCMVTADTAGTLTLLFLLQ